MATYDRYRHSFKSSKKKKRSSILSRNSCHCSIYFILSQEPCGTSLEQFFRKISYHFIRANRKLPNFNRYIAKLSLADFSFTLFSLLSVPKDRCFRVSDAYILEDATDFLRNSRRKDTRGWRVVSEGVSTRSKKPCDPGLAVIELNPGHLFASPCKLSSEEKQWEQVERKWKEQYWQEQGWRTNVRSNGFFRWWYDFYSLIYACFYTS